MLSRPSGNDTAVMSVCVNAHSPIVFTVAGNSTVVSLSQNCAKPSGIAVV